MLTASTTPVAHSQATPETIWSTDRMPGVHQRAAIVFPDLGVLPEVGSVSGNAQPHSAKVAGCIIAEVLVIFTAQKLPHEDEHLSKTHLALSAIAYT